MPPKRKNKNKVMNCYEYMSEEYLPKRLPNPGFRHHNISYPARIAIVAGSGQMKTNLLFDLIKKSPNTFSKIVVVIPDHDEPIYNFLKSKLGSQIQFFTSCAEFQIDEIGDKKSNEQTLLVFDDFITQNKKTLEMCNHYFIAGRKHNISCVFISQSYYDIPMLARKNLTYLFLKKLADEGDLQRILRNHKMGMSLQILMETYNIATQIPTDFLKIDILNPDKNKKLSHNYTDYFQIQN